MIRNVLQKNNAGFTLLFTVLIVSIVLAIALGISRVSYTELVLSSVSREGAKAFFAADAGLECGLYNDLKVGAIFTPPTSGAFDCAGHPGYSAIPETFNQDIGYDRFFFELDLPSETCSYVNIYKSIPVDSDTYTRVEAFGYNRACDVVDATLNPLTSQSGLSPDPNLVERALYAQYKNDIQFGGGNPPVAPSQQQGSPS